MGKKQKIILIIGLIVFLLMGFFPPHFGKSGLEYAPIFDPPVY